MNTLKAHVTELHYCVPLSENQWDLLNSLDKDGEDRWEEVFSKLKKAGAIERSIEYNGHFGRNIFFAIESEKLLSRVLKTIERIVNQ